MLYFYDLSACFEGGQKRLANYEKYKEDNRIKHVSYQGTSGYTIIRMYFNVLNLINRLSVLTQNWEKHLFDKIYTIKAALIVSYVYFSKCYSICVIYEIVYGNNTTMFKHGGSNRKVQARRLKQEGSNMREQAARHTWAQLTI